jgi:hypothetical protein
MLRPIQHAHLSPLLQGYTFTTDASTVTVNRGANDATAVRSGAGLTTFTQRELGMFKRGPIIVGVAGDNVADGGFACYDTLPASGVNLLETLDAAGSGDNGTGHCILLGWGSGQTDKVSPQNVKATFPRPQLAAWRITNNGTLTVSSGGRQATVTRTGTGVVTFVFNPAVTKVYGIAATPISTTAKRIKVTDVSATGLTVKTFDTAGAAADCDFYLIVAASKAYFEYGRSRSNLDCKQRDARLIAGRVTVTAGTPAITIGGATGGVDFAITDVGVGEYQIVFSKAFKRAPIVIPLAKDVPAQVKSAWTTTTGNILTFDAAGVAADDSFDFLAIGYDNATEV